MATMNIQVSLDELKAAAKAYIDAGKIALPTFEATTNNTAQLLDRIGKQYTIRGQFADHFPELDGDDLPLGKTLEEYYADLIKIDDTADGSDETTLKPIPFMKPCYSYALGDKKIAYSVLLDDLEKAVDNPSQLSELVAQPAIVSQNSYSTYRENVKLSLLGKYGDSAVGANGGGHTVFAASTHYEVGDYLQNAVDLSRTASGVVIKDIPASGGPATWALAVSGGYVTVFDLATTIAQPTDTATGENFIMSLKKYARKAGWTSSGNSLNGNAIGSGAVSIYLADDVMPNIEVQTLAGAIQADKLVVTSVNMRALPNLLGASKNIMAIMVDERGCKLHKTFDMTLSDTHAETKSQKFVRWINHTAAYSRYTFIHVWVKA